MDVEIAGDRRLKAKETHQSDDDLIDMIVNQLVAAEHSQTGQTSGKIQSAKEPDKRDEIDSNNNSNQKQQQQQQQQQHLEGAGTGTKQGDSTQTKDGASGSEAQVVYHPPGNAAPLAQHHSQGTNKGSKVIPTDDKKFLFTMAAVLCVGFVGLMMAGVCYYK
ncbi:hypothetical protein ElyMa_000939100 [Elysia marginata]|uniref:Uncharacterized protein n=1 Tax=Elysia marginata TaxID=1093978 RepID=A0AAV4HAD4_9GAST|nr:hypothetical protein ElyMa_000939100 [Elysia marginata]